MARRVTRVIEIASSVTQIASYLGLPVAVIGGLIAGFFAWTKEVGALLTTLIIIFVISSVLQSLMAATFLVDRILERRRRMQEENRAIAYHLAPTDAAIIRDEANEEAEFQLRVRLFNSSSYPLRYQVMSTKAEIDDWVTPSHKPNYVPGIIPVGGTPQVRFNSYARGRLPRSGPLRGRMEMIYRYGHAAGEFVFESRRVYSLKCDLREEASKKAGLQPGVCPVELVVVSEEDTPLDWQIEPHANGTQMTLNTGKYNESTPWRLPAESVRTAIPRTLRWLLRIECCCDWCLQFAYD
jgi:hypothetical protein